jgi:hypothetical protein
LSLKRRRETVRGMHPVGQRKCCHCNQFFVPDPRHRKRQRYCVTAECRRASKEVSQRRWLERPENRDHFRGSENVQRVREWRAANPGYWRRSRARKDALQEMMQLQVSPAQQPEKQDEAVALQETWRAQPPLLVGLIAQLTGTALQEDMAPVMRRLITRGQALLEPNPPNYDRKTSALSGPRAARAAAF